MSGQWKGFSAAKAARKPQELSDADKMEQKAKAKKPMAPRGNRSKGDKYLEKTGKTAPEERAQKEVYNID